VRIWLPRVLALLALAGVTLAILLAVTTVNGSSETTGDDAERAMQQLAGANGQLSDTLEPLSSGDSPTAAQEAARTTAELTRRLDGELEEDESDLANRLHDVYAAELAYLDAVGSTLNNPNSALRGRIGVTAQALRDVLQQVPGGDHRAIRGGMALVLYSEARVGE
jgi:hypothetical protein